MEAAGPFMVTDNGLDQADAEVALGRLPFRHCPLRSQFRLEQIRAAITLRQCDLLGRQGIGHEVSQTDRRNQVLK